MPPRYVFGLHQGAYGYYDRYKLVQAASSYRAAGIPCDGLHIDVDFQDNYRTFTHSEIKFPNAAQLFSGAAHCRVQDEHQHHPDHHHQRPGRERRYAPDERLSATGQSAERQRVSSPTICEGQAPATSQLYEGGVNYGYNYGNNPYVNAYPPLPPNRNGGVPLTSPGQLPGLWTGSGADGVGTTIFAPDHGSRTGYDLAGYDLSGASTPTSSVASRRFPQDLLMARESTDCQWRVCQVDILAECPSSTIPTY